MIVSDYAAALPAVRGRPAARPLEQRDIPALLRLEARQWSPEQAAGANELCARIERWPVLSLGSFDPRSGEAKASLFMRPFDPAALGRLRSWDEVVAAPSPSDATRSLFGISFTSVDGEAADALFRYFWPRALRSGWRDIYLGSPMPGFAAASRTDASLDAAAYARRLRRGLPADPQLRYYHKRGFTEIVTVKPGYFPHPPSHDYGVLLRGRIPLASLAVLWRMLPAQAVRRTTDALAWVVNA